jgi:parvulin-like peptidyl-prolyl isomerase
MIRRRVLPLLGLALAGCATGRAALPESEAVVERPIPSLRETINATGDVAVTPAATATATDGARPAPWADRPGSPRPQLVQPPRPLDLPDVPPAAAPPVGADTPPPPPLPPEAPPDARHDPHLQPAAYEAPAPAAPAPAAAAPAPAPDAPPPAIAAPAPAPAPTPAPPPGSAMRSDPGPRPGRYIGMTIATAGDEAIGLRELEDSVREWQRTNLPPGQRLQPDQVNELATSLLEQLIDRALLTQEAQLTLLKGDKQRQMFNDFVDKQWKEQEVPRLLRKHDAKDELALRVKLVEQNRSIDLMKQTYRREVLAREFLHQQLKGRVVRPELPQLWAYYRQHLSQFDRPARVVWREILVRQGPEGPQAARSRAEAILGRLRSGVDFATVAKADSQGPTAAKGGLWETQPGASAAPGVNAALEGLPLNAVSPIIEGPRGLHIVRVEARQPAGPAPFEAVQNEIAKTIQEQLFTKAVDEYTRDLRARSLVTYQFGRPPAPRDAAARRVGASRP